jgi:hypothetical protein
MNRYAASPALERAILAYAPPHAAVPDAPDTLQALQRAWAEHVGNGAPFPVWDGGCEHTIYSSPSVNHAFRAWHDTLHVALGAELDDEGERRVCGASILILRGTAGIVLDDLRAIRFEIVGQLDYAARHGGQFPDDQAAFVAACFSDYQSAIAGTF